MSSRLCAKKSVKSVRSVREKTPHELSCAQKGSNKSVSSVREKSPHELNCAQKGSVKSVSSVREKPPQRERRTYPRITSAANRGNLTYYSPRHSERGWG